MAFRYSISAFLLAVGTNALDNGFGRTPVMGYNTYNTVGCSPNQTHVSETMDALVEKGFLEAGYKFFQVDCGWQGYDLQANGSITYDLEKFPDGIAPLSKAAIEKGFKWSMYTNQGVYSCDTETPAIRQGSLGHEKEDALQLAAWNVEYMKVDNCYVEPPANAPKDPRTDFVTRYTAISDALQSVGIKGIAICQWGTPYISPSGGLEGPSAWTPPLSNSYRVSDDIARGWANVIRILNQGIHVNSKNLSGPGHWSDLDMMEVGNPGMTVTEQASHFAVWAMFKSTLMISTSIPAANSDTVTILQNRDLIAINQDEAGLPVTLVQRFTNDRDVYAGDLANGDKAVLLLDHSNTTRTLSLDLASIGIASATVKNLWTSDISANETSYSKQVDAHGSLPLRLSNIQKLKNTAKANITWIEAESGTVSNGAETQSCSGCSNTGKVGFLEEGKGTLTLSGIHASQETQDVLFDYVNCEIGYAFAGIGPNARLAGISVNGGAVQNVSFPLTGYNWDKDVTRNYPVRLEGFSTSGENTIEISGLYNGQSKYAPDIDRIGVAS